MLLGANCTTMAQVKTEVTGLNGTYTSCAEVANFYKLKTYIANYGIRPDEVGDPGFESIFCTNNELQLDLSSMASEEDLQLVVTSKDASDRFTYYLTLQLAENEKEKDHVLFGYETAESHLIYMELQEKYQRHFCKLIDWIDALEKK